jgi:hypothetical protein
VTAPLSTRTLSRNEIEARPEACVISNAEWVLPWVWRRRATDTSFAMVTTSAWLTSVCSGQLTDKHPVSNLILEHAENAFEVFHVSGDGNLQRHWC